MKKFLLGGLLTTSILLAACANDNIEEDNGNVELDADTVHELTLYSNSVSEGRGEWIQERASEEGFELQILDAGAGEVLNRLIAEAASPQADLVIGLDESMFMDLRDEDLLVDYTPSWIDEIPEDAQEGDGLFHPLVEQRIMMIYNPDFIDEEDAPNDWEDLGNNPEYENIYRIPGGLGGGTNQKAVMSLLLKYRDDNGEYGISEEGWEEVQKFFDNGYLTPEHEEHHVNFAEGHVPISFDYSGGLPAAEENYGFTSVPINPDQGVFVMREQVGIINKGDDQDYSAVQEFIDWYGSGEVQGAFAEEFGTMPINEIAFESADERIQEIANQTDEMDLDWEFIRENLDNWIEKIELELM